MNRKPETDYLLRDVLSEESPTEFKEVLFARTLRFVRRRRIFRQARSLIAAFALIGTCAFFGWRNLSRGHHGPQPTQEHFVLVRTKLLTADSIINTMPLDASQIVSSVSGAPIVRTSREGFRVINDRELLASAFPRPAILIRSGKFSEELKFVNAEDENVIHTE
jgi:hypothetical protein